MIVGDLDKQTVEDIAELLAGFDVVISAVATTGQLDQLKLIDAAAMAGTKRFVPCGFTSISPPGGVMSLIRNEKEKTHERIWYHHLPYTIIDSGTWFQISFPVLPSGKVDYAYMGDGNTLVADGTARSLMIDKGDIGKLTARVIKDDRTLNKRVFFNADSSSQNEIYALMEKKSGEKIDALHVSFCPHTQPLRNTDNDRQPTMSSGPKCMPHELPLQKIHPILDCVLRLSAPNTRFVSMSDKTTLQKMRDIWDILIRGYYIRISCQRRFRRFLTSC